MRRVRRGRGRRPRERFSRCARHGRSSGQLRAEVSEHLPLRVGVEARVAVMRVVVRKRERSDGNAAENEERETGEVERLILRLIRGRLLLGLHPSRGTSLRALTHTLPENPGRIWGYQAQTVT